MKNQLAIFVLLAICSNDIGAAEQAAKIKFFESKIRPVLVKHCYRCHSVAAGKSKGGLHLDLRAGWETGGDSGPAIVPFKPDESLIIHAIGRTGEASEMPPKTNLSDQIVSDFKKWIADGAVDPREGKPPVADDDTVDIETGRKFWSFQPRKTFSEQHSIDSFVQPQASPAPADKLAKRLFLDLTGLPPTPKERSEFLRLYREQSPEKAVSVFASELLTRKDFGEKWARHWLDIARYADSNGGDFNLTFHESWRYRNYVIDAFNRDVPYDQFLREQIAGDLLPFEDAEQRNRQLVATGFLMVAPKMLTERDKAKMHLDIADEQVDTIGRSIMGLTLGCARCHDHKFDPIPTADYYALAGILYSTRTANGILMGNVNVSGWTETEMAVDEKTKAQIAANEKQIKSLEREIAQRKAEVTNTENLVGTVVDDTKAKLTGPWRKSTLRPNHIGSHYLATNKTGGPYAIHWKAELPKPGKYELRVSFGGGSGLATKAKYLVRHAQGETRLVIDQTVKPTIGGLWFPIGQFTFGKPNSNPKSPADSSPVIAEVELTDESAGGYVIADAIQFVSLADPAADNEGSPKNETRVKASAAVEISDLENQLKTLKANTPKLPRAMAAKDHTHERLGDMHIRIRGETENLGRKVPRGFLQVASYSGIEEAVIPTKESGRLQLARWLTHPNHPLTARVMANRIWQQFFGRGIVATTDNFGMRGAAPSHPELLDYLAEEFVANNWSTKMLILKIVNSKTYQQAAQTAADDDPDNLLLRHQNRRRTQAETLRDSILAIAGQLDRAPRKSVVEPLGMYAIATSGQRHASLGQLGKLRQRSIYLPIVRGATPPSLTVFGLPNPDLVTGTRSVTTVPAQALFMMNSPFVREMAQAVGSELAEEDVTDEETIQQLYRRILVRDADEDDLAVGIDYLKGLIESGKTRPEAIASFVQILFSSTEFRFIE